MKRRHSDMELPEAVRDLDDRAMELERRSWAVLERRCMALGLSQSEIARRTGTNPSVISYYFRGKTHSSLLAYCRILLLVQEEERRRKGERP